MRRENAEEDQSSWYKCKQCQRVLKGRTQLFIHQTAHKRTGPQLFHLENGSVMKINQLPNSYEIFTPIIGLKTIEQVCGISRVNLCTFEIKLKKLDGTKVIHGTGATSNRQLTVRRPGSQKKIFDDDVEEAMFSDGDKDSDSDWKEQSENDDVEDEESVFLEHDMESNSIEQSKNDRVEDNTHTRRRLPARKGTQQTELNSTITSSLSSKQYTCSLCPTIVPLMFNKYESYSRHLEQFHRNNGTFSCNRCSYSDPCLTSFDDHAKTHQPNTGPDRRLTCVLCPNSSKLFETVTLKNKHMKTHLVNGKYKCPYCPLIKLSKIHLLERHMLRHETLATTTNIFKQHSYKPLLKCSICDAEFFNRDEFHKHMTGHQQHEKQGEKNASKHFLCEQCGMGFTTAGTLKRHSFKHLENNPYVCKFPDCGQRLTSKYNLEKHMSLHFMKPVVCPVCQKKFSQQKCLDRHKLTFHTRKDVFYQPKRKLFAGTRVKRIRGIACTAAASDLAENCPVITVPDTETDMNSSQSFVECKSEQQDEEGRFVLDNEILEDFDNFASRTAEVLSELKREEGLSVSKSAEEAAELTGVPENNEGNVTARIWRKALKNNPLLAQLPKDFVQGIKSTHLTGGDIGTVTCKLCPASYQRAFYLRRHMLKVHPEEAAQESAEAQINVKPSITLTCSACGFQSESSEALEIHMEDHNQQGKFFCSFCGCKFKTQVNLDKHVNVIHLSERKFECDVCSKKFPTKYRLSVHKQRVHPPPMDPKDLICKVCGKQYLNRRSLEEHLLKIHSKDRKLIRCKICNDKLSCVSALKLHIKLIHHLNRNQVQAAVGTTKESLEQTAINENGSGVGDAKGLFL